MLGILISLMGFMGFCSFIVGMRRKAIAVSRQNLARTWVSEGDIHSESVYIMLKLVNTGSNLIGSMSSSVHNKLLNIHADVGWFETRLVISELIDRSVLPIASAVLKTTNNQSKLIWSVKEGKNANILPQKTILWPCHDVSVANLNLPSSSVSDVAFKKIASVKHMETR